MSHWLEYLQRKKFHRRILGPPTSKRSEVFCITLARTQEQAELKGDLQLLQDEIKADVINAVAPLVPAEQASVRISIKKICLDHSDSFRAIAEYDCSCEPDLAEEVTVQSKNKWSSLRLKGKWTSQILSHNKIREKHFFQSRWIQAIKTDFFSHLKEEARKQKEYNTLESLKQKAELLQTQTQAYQVRDQKKEEKLKITAKKFVLLIQEQDTNIAFKEWESQVKSQKQKQTQKSNWIERSSKMALGAAFDGFCAQVAWVKDKKATCERVVRRMLHSQLAGAFDRLVEATEKLRRQRAMISSCLTRWRGSEVADSFEGWREEAGRSRAERAEAAREEERQRRERELEGDQQRAEQAARSERERLEATCRQAVQRMLRWQAAGAFDAFYGRVKEVHEQRERKREAVRRLMHRELWGAFEGFREAVEAARSREERALATLGRWRAPEKTRAFEVWVEHWEESREAAMLAGHERAREELAAALAREQERQRGLSERVVRRMLHSQLAGAFDRLVEATEKLRRQRAMISSCLTRWRGSEVADSFEGWREEAGRSRAERAEAAREEERQRRERELEGDQQRAEQAARSERERLEATCRRAVQRMLRWQAAGAFDAFYGRVKEVQEQRERKREAVRRLMHRELWGAFEGFRDFVDFRVWSRSQWLNKLQSYFSFCLSDWFDRFVSNCLFSQSNRLKHTLVRQISRSSQLQADVCKHKERVTQLIEFFSRYAYLFLVRYGFDAFAICHLRKQRMGKAVLRYLRKVFKMFGSALLQSKRARVMKLKQNDQDVSRIKLLVFHEWKDCVQNGKSEQELHSRQELLDDLQAKLVAVELDRASQPAAVALKLNCDGREALKDSNSTNSLSNQVQDDISTALGVDPSAVSILCYERGSVIAEVALKKDPGVSSRKPGDMVDDLLAQAVDMSSKLRGTATGRILVTAETHGSVSEQVCESIRRAYEQRVQAGDQRVNEMMEAYASELKELQSTLDNSLERREATMKTIHRRLMKQSLSEAFDDFCAQVAWVKDKKATCERVVRRMLHSQLAGAFDRLVEATEKLRRQRAMISSCLTRWRGSEVADSFEGWREEAGRSRAERAEAAREEERQRRERELEGDQQRAEQAARSERERLEATCRRAVQRMLRWQAAGAFDAFYGRVKEVQEQRERKREAVRRLMHRELWGAFEGFREAVEAARSREERALATLGRWRAPEKTRAFEVWVEHWEESREAAMLAGHERAREELAAALAREQERQRGLSERVVRRMLHSQLAGAFDRLVEATEKLRRQRAMISSCLTRWRGSEVADSFEGWREEAGRSRAERAEAAREEERQRRERELEGDQQRAEQAARSERERLEATCRRAVQRMLRWQAAGAFDAFYGRVKEVQEQRERKREAVRRLMHRELWGAFEGFREAVEAARSREERALATLGRWRAPEKTRAFEVWVEHWEESREAAMLAGHERAREELAAALAREKEEGRQRVGRACRMAIYRMLQDKVAMHFEAFASGVAASKLERAEAEAELGAAFEGLRRAGEQARNRRSAAAVRGVRMCEVAAVACASMLTDVVLAWREEAGRSRAERAEAAREEERQRRERELEGDQQRAEQAARSERERLEATCRRAVQRMLRWQAAGAFDAFYGRVELWGAFEGFREAVEAARSREERALATLGRWRAPEKTRAFEVWVEHWEESREAAMLAGHERAREELAAALAREQEEGRQRVGRACRMAIYRMLQDKVAMHFEAFASGVAASKLERAEAEAELGAAFEGLRRAGEQARNRRSAAAVRGVRMCEVAAVACASMLTDVVLAWREEAGRSRAERAEAAREEERQRRERELEGDQQRAEQAARSERERLEATCRRAVQRMLRWQAAGAFDAFYGRVQEVQEQRERKREAVRRLMHRELWGAFEGFREAVEAARSREERALATLGRWRAPEKTRAFEVWVEHWEESREVLHRIAGMRGGQVHLNSDSSVSRVPFLHAPFLAWKTCIIVRKRTCLLEARYSKLVKGATAKMVLFGWSRTSSKHLIEAASSFRSSRQLNTVAMTCAFAMWRINVERCVRAQMQSRISVLIQTIANLSTGPDFVA
ncbi:hypothetical protein GUITHDRAFT_114227 [Guillardia theta CCMP2712]|uniref:Sfi1 spindle body domain-containing protein n=1 Tax=Guillardia theta (strain CCMP2712) TaxID=905079 RepID=L1IV16_GUITC|nr:hypothetical protein GUITHDRAFT_114227 [Guillardia theta CCMP2712]EKX39729.1 hypothetical protein GUITHDRAFT_114227 [Guillardia theta CCMP2712]|eukprot:XP_005826709.1 hypothetical protein GUITHDRAFT_114227 [Guillardia theta CCMP2712]